MPVLLLVVLGIIEFGRLFATFAMVSGAARSATRYGTAVGNSALGTPYYLDCSGIRDAAKRAAVALVSLGDSEITIEYDRDDGAGGTAVIANCNSPDPAPLATDLLNGDRLVVTVAATYSPMVPIVPIPPLPMSFISARTIVKFISGPPECNDALDNDGDGLLDYPDDTGCDSLQDNTEADPPAPVAACNDSLDNDGDGIADFPTDLGCADWLDNDEGAITVTFAPGYPLHKTTGSPKPIYVKAIVVDEWASPITDAAVQVTAPVTLALSHDGGGVYGNGSGSCASGGNITGGLADVTVTAIRGSLSSTATVTALAYAGVCP